MNALPPARRPLPRSLYADTALPGPETPPLEGEAKADVTIVGAGFTGLSAALHLAEKGVSVRVLEAHEVGWGASGRNGGQVNPGLKFDPDEIEAGVRRRHGRAHDRVLGRRAPARLRPDRASPDSVRAHRGGTIRAAKNERNAALVRRSAEKWAERVPDTALLDGAGMRQATGTDRYVCGMLDRRGGNVNPLGYARGLARAAQQAGAKIHAGSPAIRTEKVAGGWRVTTPAGSVVSDKLALCTNGYTDALWPGLARSIVPVFSMIAATEPLPDEVAQTVMPARSVLFEVAATTVYYRMDQQNRLLMGGRSPSRDTSDPAHFQYLARLYEQAVSEPEGDQLDAFLERPARDQHRPLPALPRARRGRACGACL